MKLAPTVLRVVILPTMVLATLQVSGCAPQTETPSPGGAYFSSSAGAFFDQSVALQEPDGRLTNIASFALQHAHRPRHSPQKIIIGAGEAGIVLSEDGGQRWRVLTTPLAFVHDVVLLQNGIIVASGINSDGQGFVLRSGDQAKSWDVVLTIPFPIDTGGFQLIRPPEAPNSRVVTIELDPFRADRVYAGSSQGSIFAGEQSAKTWRTLHQLNESNLLSDNRLRLSIRDIIPSPHREGELLIVTHGRTLVRLREDKEEQVSIPRDVANPQPYNITDRKRIFDAAYIPGFPDALLVGVDDGAVLTRDGGVTWQQLALPIDQFKAFNTVAVAVSPTNTNRMLVAINSVVFRSEDGGATWNSFSLNLPSHGITSLLIDLENAARVLAVTTPIRS